MHAGNTMVTTKCISATYSYVLITLHASELAFPAHVHPLNRSYLNNLVSSLFVYSLALASQVDVQSESHNHFGVSVYQI